MSEKNNNQKKGSKKTLIIVITIVILVVVAISIGAKQIMQEGELIGIVNDIVENKDLSVDTIDINDIHTTGDYGKVEKAIKTYLNDVAVEIQNIIKISSNEKLGELLSVDNYKNDGPEFTETIAYIDETLAQLETSSNKTVQLMEKEEIINYIKDYNLNEKYEKLYEKLMFDENTEKELKESQKELQDASDMLKNNLNVSKEILNFLKDNKGKWTIQDNSIMFNTTTLLNQYNDLASKLQQ